MSQLIYSLIPTRTVRRQYEEPEPIFTERTPGLYFDVAIRWLVTHPAFIVV